MLRRLRGRGWRDPVSLPGYLLAVPVFIVVYGLAFLVLRAILLH